MSRLLKPDNSSSNVRGSSARVQSKINTPFWQIFHTDQLIKNLMFAQAILDQEDPNIGNVEGSKLTRPTVHIIAFIILLAGMEKSERNTTLSEVFTNAKLFSANKACFDEEFQALIKKLPWNSIFAMQQNGDFNVSIQTGLANEYIQAIQAFNTETPELIALAKAITIDNGDRESLIIITTSTLKESWEKPMKDVILRNGDKCWEATNIQFKSSKGPQENLSLEVLNSLLEQHNSHKIFVAYTDGLRTESIRFNQEAIPGILADYDNEDINFQVSLLIPHPEQCTKKSSSFSSSNASASQSAHTIKMPLTIVSSGIFESLIGRCFLRSSDPVAKVEVKLKAEAQCDKQGFSAKTTQAVTCKWRCHSSLKAKPIRQLSIYYLRFTALAPSEGTIFNFYRDAPLLESNSIGTVVRLEGDKAVIIFYPGKRTLRDVIDATKTAYQAQADDHSQSATLSYEDSAKAPSIQF